MFFFRSSIDQIWFTNLRVQEVRALHRDLVANPAPLGLYAFGFTTALLQGPNTQLVEGATLDFVFGWGMFFGGLAQLLAGMWEFKKQNTFGATAFSSYGAFWMGLAIWGFLYAADLGTMLKGFQMALSLWGIFTFILMFATLNINFCLFSLFLTLSVLFWVLAGGVGNTNVTKGGGVLGFIVAGIAWYIATAELMNEVYGTVVMPLGRWKLGNKILGIKPAPPAPKAEEP